MDRSYSIAEARDKFASIVHDVEENSAIELTQRGMPVAVLLSIDEYRRLTGTRDGFWDAYSEFLEGRDLAQMNIGPEVFQDLRDASTGREPGWQG